MAGQANLTLQDTNPNQRKSGVKSIFSSELNAAADEEQTLGSATSQGSPIAMQRAVS